MNMKYWKENWVYWIFAALLYIGHGWLTNHALAADKVLFSEGHAKITLTAQGVIASAGGKSINLSKENGWGPSTIKVLEKGTEQMGGIVTLVQGGTGNSSCAWEAVVLVFNKDKTIDSTEVETNCQINDTFMRIEGAGVTVEIDGHETFVQF